MRATTKAGSAIAAIGVIGGGVVFWVQAGSLPLDARWAIAVVVIGCALVSVALVFRDRADEWSKRIRWRYAVGTSFLVAAVGVVFLNFSTVYHSILVVHESCVASRAGWRCVGYQPPHDPVNVDVRLSVGDRQRTAGAQWSPGYWSAAAGGTWILQNENEYELSVRLNSFRWPERFGVAYMLPETSDLLVDQVPEPNTVSVIREDQLTAFRQRFLMWGGLLWVLGAALLYFSPWWVSLFIPRPPRETIIQEP